MITFHRHRLDRPAGLSISCTHSGAPMPTREALQRWCDDADFRAQFNAALAAIPYTAFRWETPPITAATAERPLEFVVLDSPALARTPDQRAFSAHFARSPAALVVEFSNIGQDAILVVPGPRADASCYGHLAAFVRHAPAPQQQALWAAVGEAMLRRLGSRPVWLSTAGAGVSWLHVRLDDQPKYYGHAPFRRIDS